MSRLVLNSFFAAVAVFTLGMLVTPAHAANTGNGAISGPRYTLNVIAFDHCPGDDLKGSERHMIAVQADYADNPDGKNPASISRVNDILLGPSDDGDFHVTDGNACDNDGASFLLPPDAITCDLQDPNCFNDPTFQDYAVYLRLVGHKNSGINVTTCATDDMGTQDPADDVIVCSKDSVVKTRMVGKNNKPQFDDVTKDLLTLCLDTTGDQVCDTRVELFDSSLEDYFWNWNTEGRPHAQLFFIALPD
jgi:hypothetical protein